MKIVKIVMLALFASSIGLAMDVDDKHRCEKWNDLAKYNRSVLKFSERELAKAENEGLKDDVKIAKEIRDSHLNAVRHFKDVYQFCLKKGFAKSVVYEKNTSNKRR